MTKTTVIKSMTFGDCTVCWEPMNLIKSEDEETLVCSNEICKHEEKLQHIRFMN